MSLIKQLWIAVALLMLTAFSISFAISTHTAKNYLEEQLMLKNIDNAASLALSMSQQDKDPAMMEVLLSAQFDTGHYQLIRLTSATGDILVEQQATQVNIQAPAWFVDWVNLTVPSGSSSVMDGWNLLGNIELESQTSYAYDTLWQSALELAFIFALATLFSALFGSWVLKLIINPLKQVVHQAEAIGERRFISSDEPKTHEFKLLVRSMNLLTERIKNMLSSEAQRLETMRLELQTDTVTGLWNRDTFMAHLKQTLHAEDSGQQGHVLLARLSSLADINRKLGHLETNQLLQQLAAPLASACTQSTRVKAARLNGSDFALITDDAKAEMSSIASKLQAVLKRPEYQAIQAFANLPVGIVGYTHGESISQIMTKADASLAESAMNHNRVVFVAPAQTSGAQQTHYHGLNQWQAALQTALSSVGTLQLGGFSVNTPTDHLLHTEAPLRLRVFDELHTAASIFPWIKRLQWESKVDLAVFKLAIQQLQQDKMPLCINIAAESLCDSHFRESVVSLLDQLPSDLTRLLWLDIEEYGAHKHLAHFRSFCQLVKPFQCKIGLEHAGEQFIHIANLNDLGLDYYKLDRYFVADIEQSADAQSFVRGVITLAHSIGMQVIAEGVNTEAEKACLITLGIDGLTGKAIS